MVKMLGEGDVLELIMEDQEGTEVRKQLLRMDVTSTRHEWKEGKD